MKNPGIRVPDTSKIVADSWNALSDAEKQTWRDRADVCTPAIVVNIPLIFEYRK